LLGHEGLDAVMVCTPTHLHADAAVAALQADKHVFCEKPLARTLQQADAILSAARASRATLTVGFVRRFDNQWGTMRQVVQSGRLGRPVIWRFFSGAYRPATTWFCQEAGGGPLLDGAMHNYDFALQMFGPARRVLAVGQRWGGPDHSADDTGSVIIEFASGDQFVTVWSWGIERGSKVGSFQDVIGPKGSLHWQLPPDELPDDFDASRQGAFYVGSSVDSGPLVYPKNDMFADQMRHWIEAIRAGRQPSVSGHDGRRALKLGLAVLEAMSTRRPIELGSH
ncbi:MAG: Gfo/Idh/MocA family protein, partial [Phycisphaerae bacterium]